MGLKYLKKRSIKLASHHVNQHFEMISLQSKQDSLINLKYTVTMWKTEAVKCRTKDETERIKAKVAIEKGNVGIARVHAENSIRQRKEYEIYLAMVDKLESIVSRLEHLSSDKMKYNFIGDVVNVIDKAVDCAIIKKINNESDIDEHAGVYCGSRINLSSKSVSLNDVDQFLYQIAEEAGVNIVLNIGRQSDTIKEETTEEMLSETNKEQSAHDVTKPIEIDPADQSNPLAIAPEIETESIENEKLKLPLDRGFISGKSMSNLKEIGDPALDMAVHSESTKESSQLEETSKELNQEESTAVITIPSHEPNELSQNNAIDDKHQNTTLSNQASKSSSLVVEISRLEVLEDDNEPGVTIFPDVPIEEPSEKLDIEQPQPSLKVDTASPFEEEKLLSKEYSNVEEGNMRKKSSSVEESELTDQTSGMEDSFLEIEPSDAEETKSSNQTSHTEVDKSTTGDNETKLTHQPSGVEDGKSTLPSYDERKTTKKNQPPVEEELKVINLLLDRHESSANSRSINFDIKNIPTQSSDLENVDECKVLPEAIPQDHRSA